MDIKALANIKHNGKWYGPGDGIKKVKKEDGERLVVLGVAEVDEESAKIQKAIDDAKKKAEDEVRAAAEKTKKEAEEKAEIEAEKKKEEEKK